MTHLEQRLEKDLSEIRTLIAEQARLAEESVTKSINALQTGNKQLAYDTVLRDHPINRNMRAIDRKCHRFIALHLPSAGHLRLLSAVIRVNIELERVGDYAVTIAREAVQLSETPSGSIARELERMTGETMLILKQATKSFNELNLEIARSTVLLTGQMEHNLNAVYGEMMAQNQHQKVKDTFAVFVVFTQLKRVADQAKNICEETIFAVSGDQKPLKVYDVLFVDEDNSLYSKMAEAVGRINFPEGGRFRSAGKRPAGQVNELLWTFLEQSNLDVVETSTFGVDALSHHEIAEQTVIVSLQGTLEDYFPTMPFHTSGLEWNLASDIPINSREEIESLYRETALRIRQLMELLRGEGTT
ncbi:MAG: phosphate signaling complex protein PhoU [Gammaproteobacteria bacterium]|nr:phosphate signaling complex protein PhoU [Gammaproteobacteria bacterium]